MENFDTSDIRLKVIDEEQLYTPLNPLPEFSYPVKSYIRSKIKFTGKPNNIKLTVISSDTIDEERFRSAVSCWIDEERRVFRNDARISSRLLIGLLIVASAFIILSMILSKHISVLSHTIIPVLGSVALGRAGFICIVDLPVNKAKLKMLDEIDNENIISFEYSNEKEL